MKVKSLIDICTKKESMLVMFLCGVLIFVILLPTDSNNSYLNNDNTKQDSIEYNDENTYKEQRESELKAFLESVSGVGEVNVLIYLGDTSGDNASIDGIVVAAKGAGDESVRLLIVKIVMALYGVEANKVEVTMLD